MPENLEASSVPKVDIRRYKDVWVDYNMSLEQLKKVCTKKFRFVYVDSNITASNFRKKLPMKYIPGVGHGMWKLPEVQSVCFRRYIESEEVEMEFAKMGLRPLTLFEGVSWAEKYWNGKNWQVMLGSVWRGDNGNRYVPVLNLLDDKRCFDLDWYDWGWHDGYRFLAARKDSP